MSTLTSSQTISGAKTFAPSTNIAGLVVRQTTAAAPSADVFDVQNSGGSTNYLSINSAGNAAFSGSVLAASYTGNGAGLTGLNPANLSAGTATISITGNAGTVTNGVYTTGSYSDPSWLSSLSGAKIVGNIPGNAAGFTGSLGGDVTGAQSTTSVVALQGHAVSNGVPLNGQVLQYTAGTWTPTTPTGGTTYTAGTGINISGGNVISNTGVLSVGASSPLSSSGGANPSVSLTGIVAIANGGTGSSSQVWVDLTTAQSIAGNKTFVNPVTAIPVAGTNSFVSSATGSYFGNDQGGNLELGANNATTNTFGNKPYIDFHNGSGTAQDFNVRIQNDVSGQLSFTAPGTLTVNIVGGLLSTSLSTGSITASGSVTASGGFFGDGSSVSNVNAAKLGGFIGTQYQRTLTSSCSGGIAAIAQDGTVTCASGGSSPPTSGYSGTSLIRVSGNAVAHMTFTAPAAGFAIVTASYTLGVDNTTGGGSKTTCQVSSQINTSATAPNNSHAGIRRGDRHRSDEHRERRLLQRVPRDPPGRRRRQQRRQHDLSHGKQRLRRRLLALHRAVGRLLRHLHQRDHHSELTVVFARHLSTGRGPIRAACPASRRSRSASGGASAGCVGCAGSARRSSGVTSPVIRRAPRWKVRYAHAHSMITTNAVAEADQVEDVDEQPGRARRGSPSSLRPPDSRRRAATRPMVASEPLSR